jgi:Polysaccharide lyase
MRVRLAGARPLATLLLLASAVVASAGPVVDGFETGTLGPLWTPRAEPGRITVQRDVVRSGAFALRLEVREGDVAGVGGDGEATERAEIQLAPPEQWAHFGETHEYAFSMYVPPDFPIVDVRLVTGQWKQTCNVCSNNRSPIVAQRYRGGQLRMTIETSQGRRTIYRHPEPIQGRWLDLRYRIRFHLTDGAVAAWLNGVQVVDYRGPLGFGDDPPDVYFRLGLYRNRMPQPMTIYFDDFRKERLAE